MAVIAHVILHGVTPQQYDAVRAKAGWLEQSPDGGVAHLTWWAGTVTTSTPGTARRRSPALASSASAQLWPRQA